MTGAPRFNLLLWATSCNYCDILSRLEVDEVEPDDDDPEVLEEVELAGGVSSII